MGEALIRMTGCAGDDGNGRSLLSYGGWNANTGLRISGGQGMHFLVKNVNVLGTTLTITATNDGESHSAIILPQATADLNFSLFGAEPIDWQFQIETDSDAFIVTWCLYSTWVPTVPSVEAVNPSTGIAGTSVNISGTGFGGVTQVHFGSSQAPISSTTNTGTVVTAPDGSGIVDVTVTTPAGTSATSAADQFTYLASPAVTGLNPSSGPAGIEVTVSGSNLAAVTDVAFGVVNVSIASASDNQIVVTAPDGSGTVDVTVTTPAGTSATSAADQFTYDADG